MKIRYVILLIDKDQLLMTCNRLIACRRRHLYPSEMKILDLVYRFFRPLHRKRFAIVLAITHLFRGNGQKNRIAQKPVSSLPMGIVCIIGIIAMGVGYAQNAQTAPPPLASPSAKQPVSDPIAKIQELRAKGQLDSAMQFAQSYLSNHPNDTDVMLMIGLMYYQSKAYDKASVILNQVLKKSPGYLDAKIGLIRAEIALQHYQIVDTLIADVTQQAPNNPQVQDILAFYKKTQTSVQMESTYSLNSFIAPMPIIQKQQTANCLKKIQELRSHGQVNRARQLAEAYLANYPKDADVMLMVGLIDYQEKQYEKASVVFHHVLALSPDYLDAKIGLIRAEIALQHYKIVDKLIADVAQLKPRQPQVEEILAFYKKAKNQLIAQAKTATHRPDVALTNRFKMAFIYLSQRKYAQAEAEFQSLLAQNPMDKDALLGLIDTEIAAGHETKARSLITQGIAIYPNDPDFLVKNAYIYYSKHMYARAASIDQKIIQHYPDNKASQALLKELKDLNPHFLYGLNEVGTSSIVDYISDLKTYWQFSNAYYSRGMSWGLAALSLNNASRFGRNANQVALTVSPVLSRSLYFDMTGAYANEPLLYPTYTAGVEGYYSGLPLEFSFGYTYYSIIKHIAFTKYTASVSKEWSNYWVSFRPNYYVPQQGKKSVLYSATLVRFFGTKDCSANLTLGTGTSPDLADLLTVDFSVIRNNFINFSLQLPVWNHRLLVNLGGNYQHWTFQNQRVRELSGGSLGLNYRFEGLTA